jgi:branched-chain amino acid transport system substrate-binding protein
MSHIKGGSWFKLVALFMVLALIIPVLFACGNSDKESPIESPTATATGSGCNPIPAGWKDIPAEQRDANQVSFYYPSEWTYMTSQPLPSIIAVFDPTFFPNSELRMFEVPEGATPAQFREIIKNKYPSEKGGEYDGFTVIEEGDITLDSAVQTVYMIYKGTRMGYESQAIGVFLTRGPQGFILTGGDFPATFSDNQALLTQIVKTLHLLPCGTSTATSTPIPTATPSPTVSLTATPTPTQTGPVKIGYMTAWSGPMAMAGMLADPVISLVEEQVNNAGGILGGRSIKVIKFDTGGKGPAEATAGMSKLVLDQKVAVVCFGGVNLGEIQATSEAAAEYKTLFVEVTGSFRDTMSKYTVSIAFSYPDRAVANADFITKVIKPKKIAFLAADDQATHEGISIGKDAIKEKDPEIQIVSEQYTPLDTMDYSPYISKMKASNPDLMYLTFIEMGQLITLYKQVMELGGWGNSKVYSSSPAGGSAAVLKMPAAVGIYQYVLWAPGLTFPAAKTFEQDFKNKYNKVPDPNQAYTYNAIWTAVKAIELAGTDTDREKINQAARSGQLQWDTPCGPAVFDTNGIASIGGYIMQVGEKGKLTEVKY